jgi:phosphoribosylformylglycinamidine cyclo-ligase
MIDYKSSGVDQDGAKNYIENLKDAISSTFDDNVLGGIGHFAPLYDISSLNLDNPVLALTTDGIGTKILIAKELKKYDTIGIDLVAMNVNDLLCQGALPLLFLDYIAVGELNEDIYREILSGIIEGCKIAGCALIGGETAQMPDLYKSNEFDIAGFAAGVVDKERIIDGRNIEDGDFLLGLKSSGFHSNGFTLIRRVLEINNVSYTYTPDGWKNSLGLELLTPTRIYTSIKKHLLDTKITIKGIVNITGGGFYENIARIIPDDYGVVIETKTWEIPEPFEFIRKMGKIDKKEMYSVFNMGVGMVLIVSPEDSVEIGNKLEDINEDFYIIGRVIKSDVDVEVLY